MTVEQPTTGESTEETPAASGSSEFEKFKTELLNELDAKMDKRYSGWQSLLSERDKVIKSIANSLDEVKTSQMSESEREQHLTAQEKQKIRELEAENALLKMRDEFPEAVPVFTKILQHDNPREQLEILQGILKPSAPEQPTTSKPNPETGTQEASGNVDLNNPASGDFDGLSTQQAFEKDPGLADRLLKGVQRMRN